MDISRRIRAVLDDISTEALEVYLDERRATDAIDDAERARRERMLESVKRAGARANETAMRTQTP